MADQAWVDQMKVDYREATLSEADRAMLDYVRTVTLTPAQSSEAEIVRLREVGFGDKAILEINQIAGFFAWCNRTVDGLGVELEDFWEIEGMSNI
ncbi:MAG: hypothetical protein KDE04_04155 [Anaerolineales bacterium]|nr:hypothetical protein [Anaerolineales bacterium]